MILCLFLYKCMLMCSHVLLLYQFVHYVLLIVINSYLCSVQSLSNTFSQPSPWFRELFFFKPFFPTSLPVQFIAFVQNLIFYLISMKLSYYFFLMYFGPCSKLSNMIKRGHLSKHYNGSWGLVDHGAFFTQMLHNPVLHQYTFSQSLNSTGSYLFELLLHYIPTCPYNP